MRETIDIVIRSTWRGASATRQADSDFERLTGTIGEAEQKLRELNQRAKTLDLGSEEFNETAAEIRKLEAQLKEARQAFRQVDDSAAEASRGLGRFDAVIAGLAAGAMVRLVDLAREGAQRLIEFSKEGIDLAVSLNETNSLLSQQLGPGLENYNDQLDALAQRTKRSSDVLKEQGQVFVTLTDNAGFAADAVADLSTEAIEKALDLSSAFNIDTADAIEKIRAAYTGSSEPLQSLGLDTRELTLQQTALRAGIIQTLGPLNQQERILAVNAAITEQAASAMGNATLTAGEGANAARQLDDAYYDLQQRIGQELIPLNEELTEAQLGLLNAYGDDAVQQIAEFAGLISDVYTIYKEVKEGTGGDGIFAQIVGFGRGEQETGLQRFLAILNPVPVLAEKIRTATVDGIATRADEIRSYEEAANTINAYYIGMGQVAEAEREAADEAEKRTVALRATAAVVEEIIKVERERRGGIRDNLEASYARELELLDNIARTQQTIANAEAAQLASRQEAAGIFNQSESIFSELTSAQADLAAAQGEYVTVTTSTAADVAKIQAQLNADLTDEERKQWQNVLAEAEEGSQAYLDAYRALQNDLSASERQDLVVQAIELNQQDGSLAQVFTGDAVAAEEAQARIVAAQQAIQTEYRQTVVDALLANNGLTEGTLDLAVGLGLLSQEEADARLEFVNTTQALQDLADNMLFANASTEDQIEAVQLLTLGYADNAAEAYALSQNIDGDLSESLRGATTLTQDLLTELAAIDGDRQANVNVTVAGLEQLREAAALAAGLTGVQQLVNQVGSAAEANSILERQFGAPGALPSTSTTQSTARGQR